MSFLSFYLAHSAPYTAPGLTPVHQWERDACDRNTCNYPPTLPSLEGDWVAAPFPTREPPPTVDLSISCDPLQLPSPPTFCQTLHQAPPTWDPA